MRSEIRERLKRAENRRITLTYGNALSEIQFSNETLASQFDSSFTFENPDFDPSKVERDEEFDQQYIKFLTSDVEETLFVPTGLVWTISAWCHKAQAKLDLKDWPDWVLKPEEQPDPPVDAHIIDGIELRDYQVLAIQSILKFRRGVLEIATGGGKTEVAMALVLHLGVPRTVYMVPNRDAMEESYNRFIDRGIDAGRLGDNYYEVDKPVVVGIVNSLVGGLRRSRMEVVQLLAEAELFICDECHHKATAHTWKVVAAACQAEYRVGLSGTPWKSDEVRWNPALLDMYDSWLVGFTGAALVYLPPRELQKQKALVRCRVISFLTAKSNVNPYEFTEYNDVYMAGIVNNEPRNQQICTLLANLCDLKRYPLVSIDKLIHGRALQKRLMEDFDITSACSYGGGATYIPKHVAELLELESEPAPIYEWKTRVTPSTKEVKVEPAMPREGWVELDLAVADDLQVPYEPLPIFRGRSRKKCDIVGYKEDVVCITEETARDYSLDLEPAFVYEQREKVIPAKRQRVREVVGYEEDFVQIPDNTKQLRQMFRDRDVQVLIGSKIYDEAQDITFLTDLVNAAGGKASQRYRQKVGRVLRKAGGKTLAWIWDPWDIAHHYFKNHSRKRFEIAQNEGYPCIGDWSLGEIYTSRRVKDHLLGRTAVQNSELEVKVEMTIPLAIGGQQSYTYVKPSVTLRGRLEEGDNEEECAEQLHVQAMMLFLREASNQAVQANKLVTEGFDKTRNDFVAQAQAYLAGVK